MGEGLKQGAPSAQLLLHGKGPTQFHHMTNPMTDHQHVRRTRHTLRPHGHVLHCLCPGTLNQRLAAQELSPGPEPAPDFCGRLKGGCHVAACPQALPLTVGQMDFSTQLHAGVALIHQALDAAHQIAEGLRGVGAAGGG